MVLSGSNILPPVHRVTSFGSPATRPTPIQSLHCTRSHSRTSVSWHRAAPPRWTRTFLPSRHSASLGLSDGSAGTSAPRSIGIAAAAAAADADGEADAAADADPDGVADAETDA